MSHFRGKEYVKGFVRCVVCRGGLGPALDCDGFARALAAKSPAGEEMEDAALDAFLAERRAACAYGLCVVAYDRTSFARYPALAGMETDAFRLSSGSFANVALFAPSPDCDLAGFREVVLLDGRAPARTGKARIVKAKPRPPAAIGRLDCSREALLALFSALRALEGEAAEDIVAAARLLSGPPEQAVFALSVFSELGLFRLEEGRVRVTRGKRTDLMCSHIYRDILAWKEG